MSGVSTYWFVVDDGWTYRNRTVHGITLQAAWNLLRHFSVFNVNNRRRWFSVFALPEQRQRHTMSSDLDSSLTSIDWLPQLGISSLRSGRERGGGGDRDKRKDRGKDRVDILPSLPDPSPCSSKGKPPHSYATLIAMAIAASPERKLSLNDIYTWISDTYPYYSRVGRGWKVHFISVLE